jgi:hypothetical protein
LRAARRARRAPLAAPPSALPGWLAKIFDFESWAPRSSRMWRLDQYSFERSTSSSDEEADAEAAIGGLQARIAAMRAEQQQQQQPRPQRPKPGASGGGGGTAVADMDDVVGGAEGDDGPLTAAAIARAASRGGGMGGRGGGGEEDGGDQEDEEEDEEEPEVVQPLTSDELRLLLLVKWSKQYDMAFVRRDLPGMKPFIALNVFCNALEQRSFILTEQQYCEKLEAIAARLHVLGQTARVRSFLQQPAKSQKGLPRRPTMGTAVSIMLDVTPAQVEAYFTGPF